MDRRARDHDFFLLFFLVEAVQELVDRRARGDDFKEYSTTFDLSCAKMVSKVPSLPLPLPLPLPLFLPLPLPLFLPIPLPPLQLPSLSSSSSLPPCSRRLSLKRDLRLSLKRDLRLSIKRDLEYLSQKRPGIDLLRCSRDLLRCNRDQLTVRRPCCDYGRADARQEHGTRG